MSVALARPPAAVFREEQNFAWWVYAALAGMVAMAILVILWKGYIPLRGQLGAIHMPFYLGVGFGLPSVLLVGVLRMTTEVTPSECRIWFGWVPTYRHAISITRITRVEAVTYRPLLDCGGWGIRRGRGGERVLNARGNRGVRIVLVDGSVVLIGSQCPEQLARALEEARRAVL